MCDEQSPDGEPHADVVPNCYADRQRERNAEYKAEYLGWLDSLSPDERERIDALGLAAPVDPTAITCHGTRPEGFDEEDAHQLVATFRGESDDQILLFAEALSEFLLWLVMPPGQRGLNAKAIGCRAIMAMWVLRPDVIGNLTLTEIGALVDARPEVLSRQASAFSKRFGIRGRAQFSEKTRRAQRDAAIRRAREILEEGDCHGRN